jgi:lipopolysaccharide/colanic/teichoic acid biosynthesis glycosyltransferase
MDRWTRIVAIALAIHGVLLTIRGILLVAAALTLSGGGTVGFLVTVHGVVITSGGAGWLRSVA